MQSTLALPEVSTPQRFLAEAEMLLNRYGATDEGFQAIGERLRVLARQPEIARRIEDHEPYASVLSSISLAGRCDGPSLLLTRIPAGSATPERKHTSWGIACVVKGRNRFTTWRRGALDAELTRAGEIEVSPGDFVYFHEPPRDLHSQQGIGGPSWQLALYGRNPNVKRPLDPEHTSTRHFELIG